MVVPAEGAHQGRGSSFLRFLSSDTASIFAVVVVVLYGISRPTYDTFYAYLGLSPEDVGLSETLILFRTALNVAREMLVWAGIAAIWIITVDSATRLVTRRDRGTSSARRLRVASQSSATAVCLVVLVVLWVATHSGERLPALAGFLGTGIVIGLWLVVSTSKTYRSRRLLVAAVALATLGFLFGHYQDGSQATAQQFMTTGRVTGPYNFVLDIRHNSVTPIELTGDSAQICGAMARYEYLGGSNGNSFVLVRRAGGPFVARLSNTDYGLRFGEPSGPRRCITTATTSGPLH